MINAGTLVGVGVIVASSAISSMLKFGTYGYFKEKGYGNWKAGAASGATIGVLGGLAFMGMVAMGYKASNTLVPGTEMAGCMGCGIQGLQIQEMPGAIGLLAAQKLAGLTIEQVAGLTVTQL